MAAKGPHGVNFYGYYRFVFGQNLVLFYMISYTLFMQLDRSVPSICDAREVSYVGLDDGNHTFEVCTNGSGGTSCASYNWTVG